MPRRTSGSADPLLIHCPDPSPSLNHRASGSRDTLDRLHRLTSTVAIRLRRPGGLLGGERQPADRDRRPGQRDLPRAAWRSARPPSPRPRSSMSNPEQLTGVLHVQPALSRYPAHRSFSTSGASWWSRSVISPTISSRSSSIVTRPAVPPYSSTAIAMWTRWDCRSRSRSSTSFESGTNVRRSHAGSIAPWRPSPVLEHPPHDVLEVEHAARHRRVLPDHRYTRVPRAQRTATSPGAASCAARSTISVRGTITWRTMVSPSSNTECSMAASSSSITAVGLAWSTSSRSSAWLANGPSR